MVLKVVFEVDDYVVLRAGSDAQVYTIDELDGFYVKLSYKRGDTLAYTETDVCRLMKPSEEQMKNFLL